jgi:hypothetical protein
VGKLAGIPQFAELGDQVREDLMMAARTAATATLNRRIESISDSVHERTRNFAETKQEESGRRSAERSGGPSGSGVRDADGESGESAESGEPAAEEGRDGDPRGGGEDSARRARSAGERAERREESRNEKYSRR